MGVYGRHRGIHARDLRRSPERELLYSWSLPISHSPNGVSRSSQARLAWWSDARVPNSAWRSRPGCLGDWAPISGRQWAGRGPLSTDAPHLDRGLQLQLPPATATLL